MTKIILTQEAYLFRLYPTAEQASKLRQTLGSKRFVYNHFLARRQKAYQETGKGMSYEDCANELPALKAEFLWLKEAHSQVLQQALKDLDTSFIPGSGIGLYVVEHAVKAYKGTIWSMNSKRTKRGGSELQPSRHL